MNPKSTPPNTEATVNIVSKLCLRHDSSAFSLLCLLVAAVLILRRPWSELRGDLKKEKRNFLLGKL